MRDKNDLEYDLVGENAISVPVSVAMNTTSQRTAALPVGSYRIVSDVSCFFQQGGSTIAAAANWANSHYLPANLTEKIVVSGTSNAYLAVLVSSGTGNIQIAKIR